MKNRMILLLSFGILSTLITTVSGNDLASEKARFASEDQKLNQTYARAKSDLSEWDFKALQEEQQGWLEYRDARSEEVALLEGQAQEGQEEEDAAYWGAMADLTAMRTEIVNGWLIAFDFDREWEGIWKDGSGGILLIEEIGEKAFRFSIEVVRGPTYHLGALGGEAKVNQSSARFAIAPEGIEEETWLTFLKEGMKLRVVGDNTHFFHGARAFFDGEYVRVAELDDEARARARDPEF
ncbi:MAG: lysozyme inhibitor LprI family protein [Verrucomicrobiota bacterium]